MQQTTDALINRMPSGNGLPFDFTAPMFGGSNSGSGSLDLPGLATLFSAGFGAMNISNEGDFMAHQYQDMAKEAMNQGLQQEINQRSQTIQAVSMIRAAGAGSGIQETGYGSVGNAILAAQRQGAFGIINVRDRAKVLQAHYMDMAQQVEDAASSRSFGLLAKSMMSIVNAGGH